MSTVVTQADASRTPQDHVIPRRLSLAALVAEIRALSEPPALSVLNAWLAAAEINAQELSPFRSFKPGTYARHRVFRNEFAELLVLCWRPGQRTPIHDHNGSYGAVRVCEGVMWETMFAQDAEGKLYYSAGREWRPGAVTGADVPDIHQLGNPEVSGQDLVTLHLYAPPLGVLNTYKVGSTQVGHYTPDQFIDGAGI